MFNESINNIMYMLKFTWFNIHRLIVFAWMIISLFITFGTMGMNIILPFLIFEVEDLTIGQGIVFTVMMLNAITGWVICWLAEQPSDSETVAWFNRKFKFIDKWRL